MLTKSLLLGSLSLALFCSPLSADPLVYVVSAGITGNGQFGKVDLSTGAYQQIGPPEPDGYAGLAFPNGSLYSMTYAANLDSINPQTGVPTRVGPSGLGACVVPSPSCGPNSEFFLGGLNGKLYATDFANNLYSVTPATGAAKVIGATGIPPNPYVPGSQNPDGTFNLTDEAIFSAGGKLYATYDAFVFDFNSNTLVKVVVAPELYELDPASAHATVIGPTDLNIGAVAEVNGTAYAFNIGTSQIETLDLATGKTTFVTNFDSSGGLLLGASAAVPEPGSVALAAIGLIGLALCGRRSHRTS